MISNERSPLSVIEKGRTEDSQEADAVSDVLDKVSKDASCANNNQEPPAASPKEDELTEYRESAPQAPDLSEEEKLQSVKSDGEKPDANVCIDEEKQSGTDGKIGTAVATHPAENPTEHSKDFHQHRERKSSSHQKSTSRNER